LMKEIWADSKQIAKKLSIHYLGEKGRWTSVVLRGEGDLVKLREAQKEGAERAVISCPAWSAAPQKELAIISKKLKLIAKVKDSNQAKEAMNALDRALVGFLVSPSKTSEIEKLKRILAGEDAISFEAATITGVRKTDSGERSCIDTCEIMSANEGMLVGFDANSFILVQAESSREDSSVEPRSFRVNAGAVSLYTLLSENKAEFLAEIISGDDVLIVDRNGKARKAVVGRNRIERRPLALVEAKIGSRQVTALLQDSENVCVMTPNGSKSVPKLKKGDEILVHIRGRLEKAASK
jgi:3-dehydroquinate synthase II